MVGGVQYVLCIRCVHVDRVHIRDSDTFSEDVSIPITMSVLATEDQDNGRIQQFQSCGRGRSKLAVVLDIFALSYFPIDDKV